MEGKLKSEGAKVENVRKESTDQLRLAKAEIKSLTDKIERWGGGVYMVTVTDSMYMNACMHVCIFVTG